MPDSETATAEPRIFTMRSPLFGPCRVLPHGLDEQPQTAIGYVALEGDPDNLTLALHAKGKWLRPNMKPFTRPIATWYSVEKADGTPLF